MGDCTVASGAHSSRRTRPPYVYAISAPFALHMKDAWAKQGIPIKLALRGGEVNRKVNGIPQELFKPNLIAHFWDLYPCYHTGLTP